VEATEKVCTTNNRVRPTPSGNPKLCECGCQRPAPIATSGNARRGYVKGQPFRFVAGHHQKTGPNDIRQLPGGTTVLTLRRKNGSELECFIDTTDYDAVKDYRWRAHKGATTFYARTRSRMGATTESMHRLLLPTCEEVDHKDHNGLNNRRSNLRPATHSQNSNNQQKGRGETSSSYKGVHWDKRDNKFRATIGVNGLKIGLGYFTNDQEAARAYNIAARKYFGEFALLNDVPEVEASQKVAA
jgi:hypothetical protein